MASLEDSIKSFKISPLDSFFAYCISMPFTAYCGFESFKLFFEGKVLAGTLTSIATALNVVAYTLAKGGIIEEVNEFNYAKNYLTSRGWNEELIDKYSSSILNRNLIQIASNETGFGEQTKGYLKSLKETRSG